jgi:uncharacterized protein (DUF58 family)
VPRLAQLPSIALGAAAVVVVAALGGLLWNVSRAGPPLLPAAGSSQPTIAATAGATTEDEPAEPDPASPPTAAPAADPAPVGILAAMPPPAATPAATLAVTLQEAVAAYDHADYEGATERALEVLRLDPTHVRALRIATSSACILGDADRAKEHYARLPARDKAEIARRCARWGVEF